MKHVDMLSGLRFACACRRLYLFICVLQCESICMELCASLKARDSAFLVECLLSGARSQCLPVLSVFKRRSAGPFIYAFSVT